ncbi:MAG: PilN domain-containing protein [Thermodesulfobacteriota bacterium]
MIRINLLPIRQLKKRARLKQEFLLFVASFCLLLIILTGWALALGGTVSDLKEAIAALNQRKASQQAILKEIEKMKKEKEILEQKLATIKKLQGQALTTVRIVDEVASRTPSTRMWLTSLQQAGGKLQLQGVALDSETIAQYMQQLEASEYFKDTELSGAVAQTVVADQKLKSFALTMNIVIEQVQ